MSMIHCRGCGVQIHDSAISCPKCGAPQQAPDLRGDESPIPDGIKGWSWGAFLLNWVWAPFNGVWIGLVALIPFVGIFMAFVLGVKGREWAWRAKKWDSVEHFQRVQRSWSRWAVGLAVVPTVIGLAAAIGVHQYRSYVERVKVSAQAEQAEDETQEDEPQVESVKSEPRQAKPDDRQVQADMSTEGHGRDAEQSLLTATAVVATAKASSFAAESMLENAHNCSRVEVCAQLMLDAALPRNAAVINAAASNLAKLPRPQQGDRKLAREFNKRGLDLFNQGNYAGAVTLLQKGNWADPSDVEIQSNLGLALVRAGHPEQAESALLSALELDPRRTAAWVPLAELLEAQNSFDDALHALLLAYEFSANKSRTSGYFRDRAQDEDSSESSRRLFAKAFDVVESIQ